MELERKLSESQARCEEAEIRLEDVQLKLRARDDLIERLRQQDAADSAEVGTKVTGGIGQSARLVIQKSIKSRTCTPHLFAIL